MSAFQETIIISLGGSMIVPNEIDVEFLKKFKDLVARQVANGRQVVVIAGGGKTARKYIDGLQQLRNNATSEDLDWLGIYSTHLNAHLVRLALSDLGPVATFDDPTAHDSFEEAVIVGGGWKPGWSSDYPAVLMAEKLGAKKMVNLSNISYVYDSDPRENPNAQKFEKLSWDAYRKLIPTEWTPGLSSPFDPVASEKAEEIDLEVVIMDGKKLENLEQYLKGEAFEGTVIK